MRLVRRLVPLRRLAAAAVPPALVAAVALVVAQPAAAGRTLVEWDGRTQELQTIEVAGTELVALDDIARVFRFELLRDSRRTASIRRQEGTISVRAGRALVEVGGEPVLLRSEVRRKADQIYVPIDFIPRAVARLLGTEARHDDPADVIRFDALTDVVACEEYADRLRVTLQLRRAAELSEVVRDGRRRILVITNQELPAQSGGCRFTEALSDLEVRPTAGQTRLTFFTGPRFASLKVYDLPDSRQLVFDFFNDSSAEPVLAAPETRVAHPHDVFDLVVLDPGHGGDDRGAVGPAGLAEKTLTLAVAQELARQLRDAGFDVILTRTDDSSVPLEERTTVANRAAADLFLSLHADARLRPDSVGARAHVFADGSADGGAGRDDRVRGGRDDLELVRWDLAQRRHGTESGWLGEALQRQLDAAAGLSDTPVERAPLLVLRGAAMPAALVELGDLTNAAEERRMAAHEFRERIARAIVRAVAAFRDETASRRGGSQ